MGSAREFLNARPWIAWTACGVAVLVAVAFASGIFTEEPADSLERRSQEVTIRCTETGEEWTMNRGEFERVLLLTPGQIDANGGIPSPYADNRPTGILVDKKDWTETVNRINAQKEAYSD